MEIKLTQYSKAAGCGCKLSPTVLEEILKSSKSPISFPGLLVGNESKDDAAVFELPNGDCIISTTDFFTPIVDDPYDFGRIAATNAISDIYAMGGTPIMAIAILVWPIDKIPAEIAQKVIEGARVICEEAGIPLAGGHSIDNQEPIFGLAVTGTTKKEFIKKNNTPKLGDILYLTKPIGVGMLGTAQKRGILAEVDYQKMVTSTTTLNKIGAKVSQYQEVHAITDVTGFGLIGHLGEMLEGTNLSARIIKKNVPKFEIVDSLIAEKVAPGGTKRNYEFQKNSFNGLINDEYLIYCDPQTSGGLLISMDAEFKSEFENIMKLEHQFYAEIGQIVSEESFKIIFE